MATKTRAPATEQKTEETPVPEMRKVAEDDPLAGIDFADEPPLSNVVDMPIRTKESDRANQEAALKAILTMKHLGPNDLKREAKKTGPDFLTAEEAAKIKPKLYILRKPVEVAKDGRLYTLKAGKIFSENEYNLGDIRRIGGPDAVEPYKA